MANLSKVDFKLQRLKAAIKESRLWKMAFFYKLPWPI